MREHGVEKDSISPIIRLQRSRIGLDHAICYAR